MEEPHFITRDPRAPWEVNTQIPNIPDILPHKHSCREAGAAGPAHPPAQDPLYALSDFSHHRISNANRVFIFRAKHPRSAGCLIQTVLNRWLHLSSTPSLATLLTHLQASPPHLSLPMSPVLTIQAIQFYILHCPQIWSPLSTRLPLSRLSLSVSSAPPPGRPPDRVQPSSTPAIGGTFLKCKSDPVADLQGLLITLRIKPKLLNTANKAPGDLAPPALVSPPIYPHPTHPGPATLSLYYTSHFLASCLCLCCPLGLLSLLYIQFKRDLLQEVLPDSHPLQVGEMFLCSGLP